MWQEKTQGEWSRAATESGCTHLAHISDQTSTLLFSAKLDVGRELSRVSGAMGAMVQASQLGVAKIVHFGDDEQKKTWLPAIAAGECLPTIAVTEPESAGTCSA